MTNKIMIQADSLSKVYKLYSSPLDRLKESIHPLRKQFHHDFIALNNVSFTVMRGETLGIIGKNGCGKSTLLKIIAGVLTPTSGSFSINGKVSALLELGAGFNPELTGMENIYFSGTIMGMNRKQIDAIVDDIVLFADIGDFINQPVKMYSNGMFVRLAFAVATCVSPEILIVDEALSVGDIFFQQKCYELMDNLMNKGTSVILVSHDMAAIEKYSTNVMVLDQGKIIYMGHPGEGVLHYYGLVGKKNALHLSSDISNNASTKHDSSIAGNEFAGIHDWPDDSAFMSLKSACSIGETDWVQCTAMAVCNLKGESSTVFTIGETAVFFTEFEILKDIMVPLGGITIINKMNQHIYAKGLQHFSIDAPSVVEAGRRVRFRQEIKLAIAPGEYTFWALFGTMNGYDYIHAKHIDHAILSNKITSLLRVTRIGSITINAERFLPFAGHVDLPDSCTLTVL